MAVSSVTFGSISKFLGYISQLNFSEHNLFLPMCNFESYIPLAFYGKKQLKTISLKLFSSFSYLKFVILFSSHSYV